MPHYTRSTPDSKGPKAKPRSRASEVTESLEEVVAPESKHRTICPLAFLLNVLTKDPPLRRRSEQSTGLTVFEMTTTGSVLYCARGGEAYKEVQHDYARQWGGRAIYKAARQLKARRAEVDHEGITSRKQYKRRVSRTIREAGSAAYSDARERFILKSPLVIIVGQAELLRVAGVSPSQAKNLRRLKAALARLTQPVVPSLPPLLKDYRTEPNGKLRLTVNVEWLPRGNFTKVPWPPPKGGPHVLALYLFLFACNHEYRYFDSQDYDPRKSSISLAGLYRRLGITEPRPAHALRTLRRALKCVNTHLARQVVELTAKSMPTGFTMEAVAGGHVAFYPSGEVVAKSIEAARERHTFKKWLEEREPANERDYADDEAVRRTAEAMLPENREQQAALDDEREAAALLEKKKRYAERDRKRDQERAFRTALASAKTEHEREQIRLR